jgi:protein-disulfide isomerase
MDQEMKRRLSQAVNKSYYKHWYKRWWGFAIIIFLALASAAVIYLGILIIENTRHIKNGDYKIEGSGAWLTKAQFEEGKEKILKSITDDDPWLGAEEPVIYIVAYESFGCPFCKENQADIKQLIAKFGPLLRFVSKDFPTESLHPNVMSAHLAANCANEQGKYWEYRDLLYANQATQENPELFSKENLITLSKQVGLNNAQFKKCLDDEKFIQEIRQDVASGYNVKVVGTPSYIVNGALIEGEIKFPVWEKLIGYILQNQQ